MPKVILIIEIFFIDSFLWESLKICYLTPRIYTRFYEENL